MALPNNYPDTFVENFLPAIFNLASKDWLDPKYHEEADQFLKSEAAHLISGGYSERILEKLEAGWIPCCKKTTNGRANKCKK